MIRVNPSELLARYRRERKALILAMITHNAIAAIIGGLFSHSAHRWPLLLIPIGWAIAWTFLPLRRLAQLEKEKRLAEQNRAAGFSVSDAGISCNIALLEGDIRHALRAKNQGVYQAAWDDIASITVLPERIIRSHEPQYRRMQHVIAGMYVLKLAKGGEARIVRTQLLGHEADIVNFIRTHTKVPVEIEDKLS